jgi:N-formylglutamate deformylase
MRVFEVQEGDGPVILAQPHGGTHVPEDIFARLNEGGQGLDDTDWHINRLYDGLLAGATVVRANFHRYVIDANRDPDGASLYPGQNTTGLCPTTDFDGVPIWRQGQAPSKDEIAARRETFHAPFHGALKEQIERVVARHGVALVYDCHSIRSNIAFLFEGELPVFNIGTDNGATCDRQFEADIHRICLEAHQYNTVLNGRFRGGWTVRHYASPQGGVHCVQMELAQRAYMGEVAPWVYGPARAEALRAVLGQILAQLDRRVRALSS